MDVFVLLGEEDGVRTGEDVNGLQDGVEGWWAFRPVEEKGLFSVFDWFRVAGFEDAGGARVAGFAGGVLE